MTPSRSSITLRTGMVNGGHLNGPIVRGVQIATEKLTVDQRRQSQTLHWLPWRHEGCQLYACVDPEDVEGINDIEVGSMLTEVMAGEVVMSHNAALRNVDTREPEELAAVALRAGVLP